MAISSAVPVAIRKRSIAPASADPEALATPETALTNDRLYTRKRVACGEALYRAGGHFDSLYAVRSGFFKITATLEDGRDQVTGFHMAGEVLGLDGIDSERHVSDAIALEDSEVCIIPYAWITERGLQRLLYRVMSRELVRDQGAMLLLGTMCSTERLAAFLLNLSRRFVARGFSPHEFRLRMTRGEIGSYLGLSLETVSRLFSRFQDERLVTVDRKHILIHDIEGLKAVLGRTDPPASATRRNGFGAPLSHGM